MDTSPNTEQRLIDLEIKASFNEDLLDKLDQIIIRQQQQIDLLTQEVTRLRQPVPNGGTGIPRDARDDMPPHY
jgi:SlyX protein